MQTVTYIIRAQKFIFEKMYFQSEKSKFITNNENNSNLNQRKRFFEKELYIRLIQ